MSHLAEGGEVHRTTRSNHTSVLKLLLNNQVFFTFHPESRHSFPRCHVKALESCNLAEALRKLSRGFVCRKLNE